MTMKDNDDDSYKPRGTPYTIGQYAVISIILTPLTAVLLSFYGFIPFDIYQAGISGLAFSLVYVGYRWYYAKQYRKEDRAAARKSLEVTNEEQSSSF
ncbi:MAG: hypothetical protein KAQ65_04135 [Candidatus Thorarchaeota archaeon]|nr:hypothetical protein [Candidatus Thorarchaeota archaeon]MCK5238468.1 hypothetical protein [Candidatus Thorarchaeota archaeon]